MFVKNASRMLILPLALGVSMFAAAQDSAASPASADKSANASASGNVAAMDKTFVMKAAEGGMAEVELGNLAKDKAQNDDVKKFAQRMVDDHSKANDQLKSIAQQKNITLPASLPAKEQATKDKLSRLSGAEFDHAYMQHMLMDHKKDVAEFKKASASCKDDDIKQFASSTLPTLQDHLKEARQVAGSTNKSAADKMKSDDQKATATSNQ